MYGNPTSIRAPMNYASVSYDTSSQDPVLVRSRVFVGNVSNQHVTREQLIDMYSQYGRVLGLTFFKGFAFIQYSNEQDANRAVISTNGIQLAGVAIDVKLAATQQKNFGRKSGGGGGGGGGFGGAAAAAKRELSNFADSSPSNNRYQSTPAAKMARYSDTHFVAKPNARQVGLLKFGMMQLKREPLLCWLNEKNQKAAQEDTTAADDLADRDVADTMICGTCRHVFTDFVEFRDHRKAACVVPSKPEDEPPEVVCFVCKETFEHSWTLLGHLSKLHHLTVFASDSEESVKEGEKKVKEVTQSVLEKAQDLKVKAGKEDGDAEKKNAKDE